LISNEFCLTFAFKRYKGNTFPLPRQKVYRKKLGNGDGAGVQVTLKAPLKPLQSLQSAAGAGDGTSIAPDQNGALEAFTERFIMGGTSYRFVIPNSVTTIGEVAFYGCFISS